MCGAACAESFVVAPDCNAGDVTVIIIVKTLRHFSCDVCGDQGLAFRCILNIVKAAFLHGGDPHPLPLAKIPHDDTDKG